MRQRLALLVVVLLLAGCTGGPATTTPDTQTPATDARSTDAPTPSATDASTTSPTTSPTSTETPTATPALETDLHRGFDEQHAAALRRAGSFVATTNVTVTFPLFDGRVTTGVASHWRVDYERNVVNGTVKGATDYDGYDTGTVQYRRYGNESNHTYTRNRTLDRANLATAFLDEVPGGGWTYTGMQVRDGRTVAVYQTSNATTLASLAGVDPENVTRANATLFVDRRDVVRAFTGNVSYRVEDETWVQTYDFAVRDVGRTTVERPTWVDEAKRVTDDDRGTETA